MLIPLLLMSEELKSVMELLLPSYLIEHFNLVKVDSSGEKIKLYLEEHIEVPKEYKHLDLIGHGFHKQSSIKDFPIRGRQVYLYIKRRRWLDKKTNQVYSRDWKLAAKGTRMTEDFAAFLKELD